MRYQNLKMIQPEDHQGAISSVRFLAGVANGERQYTFAEVYVKNRTTKNIKMTFYVPNDSDAKDESALVTAMGGSPINDALDSWNLKTEPDEYPTHVHSVTFEQLDIDSTSAIVSGCNRVACMLIPPGPCIANACWSHKANPRSIFIPTQNESLQGWRVDAVVIGGFAETSGKKAERPLARAFRFDLAFTQGVVFGNLDNSILISRWSPALPFHNLWVPRVKQEPNSREYFGISGVHFVDNTSRRLIILYDVNLMTIPVVCGCFLRHSTSFPDTFVPLTVPERVTRTHPIVFSDNPDGTFIFLSFLFIHILILGTNSILMSVAGQNCFVIDPTVREHFKGVDWVSMKTIDV